MIYLIRTTATWGEADHRSWVRAPARPLNFHGDWSWNHFIYDLKARTRSCHVWIVCYTLARRSTPASCVNPPITDILHQRYSFEIYEIFTEGKMSEMTLLISCTVFRRLQHKSGPSRNFVCEYYYYYLRSFQLCSDLPLCVELWP